MSDTQPERTEISELGEFGLIHHLTSSIENKLPSTIKGIGDDAAVIENKEDYTLLSKDLLVEGVHFDLTYYPLKHLGYKAIAVNISDIAAMNATPKQVLVGIAISNRFPLEALEEIYSGMKLACEKYNVDFVGGDTTSSTRGLFLSVTIVGTAKKEDVVYRNTAGEGDLLCCSGDLGGAYMGLLLLEREKQVYKVDPNMQPDLEGYDYVLERQLKPEPRMDIIRTFRELELRPTSMIDISDGLASEVMHLCKNSLLGCNVYEDKIPLDATTLNLAKDFNIDPSTAALNGGEDYELLFTIRQQDFEKLKNHPDFSIIGHMTDPAAGINLITRSGQSVAITAQGWDSLKED